MIIEKVPETSRVNGESMQRKSPHANPRTARPDIHICIKTQQTITVISQIHLVRRTRLVSKREGD